MLEKDNTIIVMHEDTWESVKEAIFERAVLHDDPIEYIRLMSQAEIVVDNSVQYGVTELWDRDEYEKFNELGDNSDGEEE